MSETSQLIFEMYLSSGFVCRLSSAQPATPIFPLHHPFLNDLQLPGPCKGEKRNRKRKREIAAPSGSISTPSPPFFGKYRIFSWLTPYSLPFSWEAGARNSQFNGRETAQLTLVSKMARYGPASFNLCWRTAGD